MNKLFSKLVTSKELKNLQDSQVVTTPKTLIENNRIPLPSMPDGDFIFNMAMVFDSKNKMTLYDKISVAQIDKQFFAEFDSTAKNVNGHYGVVSYMSQVVA